MPPPQTDRPAQNRRLAAALLELGADALALAVRATTGRTPRQPAGTRPPGAVAQVGPTAPVIHAPGPSAPSAAPSGPTSGEDAAARIDAARQRLRSRIAAPADENREHEPPAAEQRT